MKSTLKHLDFLVHVFKSVLQFPMSFFIYILNSTKLVFLKSFPSPYM